jgi:transcriptional regulator of acetoin/glycerol metabolism
MTYRGYLQQCAREYLQALLAKHAGNVRSAAAEAGISRATLYRDLHRVGLLARRPRVGGNSAWQALQ